LFDLFTHLGYKCGLISTVEYRIGSEVYPSTHTTPDTVSLHRLFAKMSAEGCTHVFMEVSSHALDQDRIAGIPFAGAIFTNITHDHLDYHITFDNYIKGREEY
jgi:UDP-N-acetylmuramoyl-L-alanyl-D-glutamate--2,6-diaminopimelate ligase